ncbi:MAG: pyridoxal-phosphate dependent enzyme [Halarsenatibacteraceae bacterium]
MEFECLKCGERYLLENIDFKCDCGGLFKIPENPLQYNTDLELGEVKTPLLKKELAGHEVYYKLDYYQPTGSFKDRGARLMIGKLKEAGINEIIEDSSGNAGAAVAAYSAAAGITCNIYLPEATSAGKITQIEATGAVIHKIPGDREVTSRAVRKAAKNKYYASHVYNPLFFAGVASLAQELVEDLQEIDEIILPVGNGSLLLGVWHGLQELLAKDDIPRLIAVQAEPVFPIWADFYGEGCSSNTYSKNLAEGIAIKEPARKKEIIKAVKESRGEIILVEQSEIKEALNKLWKQGIYIEPTSAVTPAAAIKYFKNNKDFNRNSVIILTGSGLKYK